jgi:hypothetical protein
VASSHKRVPLSINARQSVVGCLRGFANLDEGRVPRCLRYPAQSVSQQLGGQFVSVTLAGNLFERNGRLRALRVVETAFTAFAAPRSTDAAGYDIAIRRALCARAFTESRRSFVGRRIVAATLTSEGVPGKDAPFMVR